MNEWYNSPSLNNDMYQPGSGKLFTWIMIEPEVNSRFRGIHTEWVVVWAAEWAAFSKKGYVAQWYSHFSNKVASIYYHTPPDQLRTALANTACVGLRWNSVLINRSPFISELKGLAFIILIKFHAISESQSAPDLGKDQLGLYSRWPRLNLERRCSYTHAPYRTI